MPQTTSHLMLSDEERVELRRLVEEVGEQGAVELLAINRATLARALGSLPVRRATLIALRVVLERRQHRNESALADVATSQKETVGS
jgi:hypothetical protein